jgi:hypothetical protein
MFVPALLGVVVGPVVEVTDVVSDVVVVAASVEVGVV